MVSNRKAAWCTLEIPWHQGLSIHSSEIRIKPGSSSCHCPRSNTSWSFDVCFSTEWGWCWCSVCRLLNNTCFDFWKNWWKRDDEKFGMIWVAYVVFQTHFSHVPFRQIQLQRFSSNRVCHGRDRWLVRWRCDRYVRFRSERWGKSGHSESKDWKKAWEMFGYCCGGWHNFYGFDYCGTLVHWEWHWKEVKTWTTFLTGCWWR